MTLDENSSKKYFLFIYLFRLSLTLQSLFNHCPFLLPHGEDVQKVLEQWKEYKMGVPTFGAIILDETLDNASTDLLETS